MTVEPAALRKHLVASAIAGEVATTRANNLDNIRRTLDGDENVTFGIEFTAEWSFDRLFEVMVRLVGIHADPSYDGIDTIDPDRTIERLTRMRARLRSAAQHRESVLLATGHPANLLPVHQAIARRLQEAGCRVLTGPLDDVYVIGGVHVYRRGGGLPHTHSPDFMRRVLADLHERPDLVVADHGWAGAAAQAGLQTVGFADCNDPGLFVGEEQRSMLCTVPLDDGVAPHLYDPMIEFLLDGVGWTGPDSPRKVTE
ncbi:MAG: phosphatase [Frankiales bacterium]|nr:phosphatase [Frankiales bacterium]